MERHPIESIMTTTMDSIRDMVDVNTVVGEPVAAGDGSTIIPISRVSFGFVAGGGEYSCDGMKKPDSAVENDNLPFAGGTGAGVSVQPVGFLVLNGERVRLLNAEYADTASRIVELVPQLMCEIKDYIMESREQKRRGAMEALSQKN